MTRSTLFPVRRNREDNTLGYSSFPALSSWVDDIINNHFGSEFMSNYNTGISLPAVNVIDNDDDYIVEMAIPGMKKSDFDINIENQTLSISAESSTENEDQENNYTRREFGYASFKRTFMLPKTVDAEKISAKYTDGVLKIHIPKLDEAKKKPIKKIEIA